MQRSVGVIPLLPQASTDQNMHAESGQSIHFDSTAQFGLCGKVFLGRIQKRRDFEAHCHDIVDCLRISRQKTVFWDRRPGQQEIGLTVWAGIVLKDTAGHLV